MSSQISPTLVARMSSAPRAMVRNAVERRMPDQRSAAMSATAVSTMVGPLPTVNGLPSTVRIATKIRSMTTAAARAFTRARAVMPISASRKPAHGVVADFGTPA